MDELEERIAARLNEAVDQALTGGFAADGKAHRGVIDIGDMHAGDEPWVLLTIADVARIAAQVARESGVNGG